MPTYEYECDKCRVVFEIRQRITEPALTTHDDCGGAVRRLLSPAPFILKGDGWYVTDYPSESRKKAMDTEKGGKTESKPDTKPETKPDTKPETKSGTKTDAAPAKPAAPATTTTSAGASSPSSSSSSTT